MFWTRNDTGTSTVSGGEASAVTVIPSCTASATARAMSRAPRRTAGLFAADSSNMDLINLPSYQAGKLIRVQTSLQAVSNRHRREILRLVWDAEMSSREIASHF